MCAKTVADSLWREDDEGCLCCKCLLSATTSCEHACITRLATAMCRLSGITHVLYNKMGLLQQGYIYCLAETDLVYALYLLLYSSFTSKT